jgi:Arc/MetJ family transcription regulator
MVYDLCMSRTNIDLDDALVREAMRRFHLKTKKDAVTYALENLVGRPATSDFLRSVRGLGWDGDLAKMRSSRVAEWVEADKTQDF